MDVTAELIRHKDEKYKAFSSSLMPTVNADTVIGVRAPELKKIAKQLFATGEYEEFLSCLPHYYYEENTLHAYVVNLIKDYDRCVKKVDEFLPYIDNWATCDVLVPKAFKASDKLKDDALRWISSGALFSIRFGIGVLMRFFLGERFDKKDLCIVASVKSDEYYVKMMQAWYFATALCKQYDYCVKFMESENFDKWTYNKAIQKAVESYRISNEKKEYLKGLKKRR